MFKAIKIKILEALETYRTSSTATPILRVIDYDAVFIIHLRMTFVFFSKCWYYMNYNNEGAFSRHLCGETPCFAQ
jgi:hypothetical protein